MYTVIELTPQSVNNPTGWSNESNALTDDGIPGTWAVNSSNDTEKIVFSNFDNFPSSGQQVLVGVQIVVQTWVCDASGIPYGLEGGKFYNLRFGLSMDGGTTESSTTIDVECVNNEDTIGDPNDLWGLSSVEEADFGDFCVWAYRATDLTDEGTLVRSIEHLTVLGSFIDKSIGLAITGYSGGCDGIVDVTWSG